MNDRVDDLEHRLGEITADRDRLAEDLRSLKARLDETAADRDRLWAEAESWFRQIKAIEESRTWRLGLRIRSNKAYQRVRGSALRLQRMLGETRGEGSGNTRTAAVESGPRVERAGVGPLPSPLADADDAWIRAIRAARPAALAILHPDWRGVRSCLENLLSHRLYLRDDLDPARAKQIARAIADTGCERVLLGGFPFTYRHLVLALRRDVPKVRIHVLWLGSFLQSNEDYGWQGFRQIEQFCRDGAIVRWGFAKAGMAEAVARTGARTGFVMSYARSVPKAPSVPDPGGPHLGIWSIEPIWRKSPFAMLAAAAMIPGAKIHGTGASERVDDFIRFLKIDADLEPRPRPQDQMPAALARMHLNLYVTLSECAPMLPLESLAAGTPCLLGPTSHFFENDPYLASRLIVPCPDRSDVIAEYIGRALAEREQIITAYRAYAPGYNARAQRSLRDFLEVDADAAL